MSRGKKENALSGAVQGWGTNDRVMMCLAREADEMGIQEPLGGPGQELVDQRSVHGEMVS